MFSVLEWEKSLMLLQYFVVFTLQSGWFIKWDSFLSTLHLHTPNEPTIHTLPAHTKRTHYPRFTYAYQTSPLSTLHLRTPNKPTIHNSPAHTKQAHYPCFTCAHQTNPLSTLHLHTPNEPTIHASPAHTKRTHCTFIWNNFSLQQFFFTACIHLM